LSNGLGSTIRYLRCTTRGAVANCLGTTIKYLVNQNAGAILKKRANFTKML
jgi:hypothetical protein